MSKEMIRRHLIDAGCKNLREFGYPGADPDNILKEYIFRSMFDRMLEDNLGKMNRQVDAVIKELRSEIAENSKEVSAQ